MGTFFPSQFHLALEYFYTFDSDGAKKKKKNTDPIPIWKEDGDDEGRSHLSGSRASLQTSIQSLLKTLELNVLFALSCSPQGNVPKLMHSAAPSNSANGDDGTDGTLSLRTNMQTVSLQQVTHRNAARL